jgi:uncharacterized membrane protein YdjX (TVP38/TMEM64 family)
MIPGTIGYVYLGAAAGNAAAGGGAVKIVLSVVGAIAAVVAVGVAAKAAKKELSAVLAEGEQDGQSSVAGEGYDGVDSLPPA